MLPKSFQDKSNDTWGRQNAPEKGPWDLRYPSHCSVGIQDVKCRYTCDCSSHSKVDEVISGFLFHLLKDREGRRTLPIPSLSSRVPHSFAPFASEWVIETFPIPELLVRTIFDLQGPLLKVYPHCSWFSIKVRPKAAPFPMFRLLHQAPLHRVPVHVTQLLNPLALAPDIEIIEPFLPDRNRGGIPEPSLCR